MDRRPFPLVPTLVLLTAAAAACRSDAPTPGGDRASPEPMALPPPAGRLTCRPLRPEPGPGEPTDLFPAGDSAFGVLYARGRVVELWSDAPDRIRSIGYERRGPLGVMDAAGAARLGDGRLALADRPRGRIKLLTPEGRDAGAVELGFPPQAVASAGARLYVSPVVLEASGGPLLHVVAAPGSPPEARPVGIRPLPAEEPGWRALGNLVALAGADDGSLLLAHRLARARAFLLPAGGGRPRPLRLAVAGEEAAKLGVQPPVPFGQEALDRIAVPVVDVAVGRAPGVFAYLTRSGRRTADGRPEKLLVRVDSAGLRGPVLRVPVDGRRLLRLPRTGLWVISDDWRLWGCAEPGDAG